jgi:hypothetical protein
MVAGEGVPKVIGICINYTGLKVSEPVWCKNLILGISRQELRSYPASMASSVDMKYLEDRILGNVDLARDKIDWITTFRRSEGISKRIE